MECFDRETPPGTEITWLPQNDSYAYWNAIQALWKGEEDLLIIEQDIAWEAAFIKDIENCLYHWCVYEYDAFASDDFTVRTNALCLGFTKFSADMQKQYPVEAIQANIDQCDLPCRGSWIHLDMHIAATLKHGHCFCCRKIHPHVHGKVEHLHDYTPPTAMYPERTDEVDPDKIVETLRARGWTVADPSLIRLPEDGNLLVGKTETKVVNHVQRG